MRSALDHLPPKQQHELDRIRSVLLEEFEAARRAGAGGTSDWRRSGRVLKLVLFGSYARDDWVDEPENGYQSDFDILAVVSHANLTDIADYWWTAEDKLLRDPEIGRTVNVIVHTMEEVNGALSKGEPFWTDIVRDGIALHEVPGHAFATPQPISAREAADTAARYLSDWTPKAQSALKGVRFFIAENELRDAAFLLHQGVERAYICFLLVHTFYFPRSHNIKFLRSLAEDADKALVAAWPRDNRRDRRRFELLKRAYVEARYSDQYAIEVEDLEALMASCVQLLGAVERLCMERIAALRASADAAS